MDVIQNNTHDLMTYITGVGQSGAAQTIVVEVGFGRIARTLPVLWSTLSNEYSGFSMAHLRCTVITAYVEQCVR